MVEELGEGVWGAETRYGRSEAGSVWFSIYIGEITYLVQALEYILKDARPLGAVAR
jgi:hypothetical protein